MPGSNSKLTRILGTYCPKKIEKNKEHSYSRIKEEGQPNDPTIKAYHSSLGASDLYFENISSFYQVQICILTNILSIDSSNQTVNITVKSNCR